MYIKTFQTGFYFFGWVYFLRLRIIGMESQWDSRGNIDGTLFTCYLQPLHNLFLLYI